MKQFARSKRLIALNLAVLLLLVAFAPIGALATISGVTFPTTIGGDWGSWGEQIFQVQTAGTYTFRVKPGSINGQLHILDAQGNEVLPVREIDNGAAFTTDVQFALQPGQHRFVSTSLDPHWATPPSLQLWLWENDTTPPTNNPWSVSVSSDGNGWGSASARRPAPNERVTLSANPSHGFEFDRWNVLAGGVTLSDERAPDATFTMPSRDVRLEATFRLRDDAVWVEFRTNNDNWGFANEKTSPIAIVGEPVDLWAFEAADAEFVRWEVRSGDVTIDDPTSPRTFFTMNSAATDVEIWAMFTPIGVPLPDTPITSVSITPSSGFEIIAGGGWSLTATVLPTYATNRNVTWSSSNTAVATVDANGRVTAVAPGTATITVRTAVSNRTASITVTVISPIDRAPLQALVTQSLTRDGADYTNATWRAFAQALAAAEAAIANLMVTQGEIDAAYKALQEAVDELVTIASFENPFEDVAENNWFFENVMYAYANRLMTGTTGTRFAPNATLSRGMVVTVLYRMEGEPEVDFEPIFNDVAEGRWYSDAVIWAYQNEIVQGISANRFAPGNDITREQLATMLYRYARFMEYDLTVPNAAGLGTFADYGEVNTWAEDAMRWAVYHELVRGSNNNLMPRGDATRAQYATILQRLIDRFEFDR